jgi:hypothetical protein
MGVVAVRGIGFRHALCGAQPGLMVRVRPTRQTRGLYKGGSYVATGDSGCEAYTAIAWGVGLSHERSYIAGAESFYSLEGNMCGTLSDVLTPCRGRRPHHVQKDRIGSWEVSCLTVSVA